MSCILCEPDFYTDKSCGGACIPCPHFSSTQGEFGRQGAHSCHCFPGYSFDAATETCVRCPLPYNKFYCPGNAICTDSLVLARGGWYSTETSLVNQKQFRSAIFHRCPIKDWCPYQIGDMICTAAGTPCREGHTGYLCSECQSSYYRLSPFIPSNCARCPSYSILPIIGTTLVSVLSLGIILWIVIPPIERTLTLRWVKADNRTQILPKLRLFFLYLAFLFCMGTFSLDLDFGLVMNVDELGPFPTIFRTLLLFSLNTGYLVQFSMIDCITSQSQEAVDFLLLTTVVPFVYVFILSVVAIIIFTRLSSQKPLTVEGILFNGSEEQWQRFLAFRTTCRYFWSLIIIYMIILPSLTRHYSINFPCIDAANNGSVKLHGLHLPCYGPASTRLTSISLTMLILFTFGTPLITLIGLSSIDHLKIKLSTKWYLIIGLITDGYREHRLSFLYYPIEQLLTMTMIFLSFKLSGDHYSIQLKCGILMCFTGVFLFAHLVLSPYESVGTSGQHNSLKFKSCFKHVPYWYDTFKKKGIINVFLSNYPPQYNVLQILSQITGLICFLSYALVGIVIGLNQHNYSVIIAVLFCVLHCFCLSMYMYQLYIDLFPNGFYQWGYDVYEAMKNFWRVFCLRRVPNQHLSADIPVMNSTSNPLFGCYSAIVLLFGDSKKQRDIQLEFLFEYLILSSPFPSEAIAQLKMTIQYPKIDDVILPTMIGILIENGYIEPQTVSILPFLNIIQQLYRDASRSVTTHQQFVDSILKILLYIEDKLNIASQVIDAEEKAKTIAVTYTMTKQLLQPKKQTDMINWKDVLNVQHASDIRMRFFAAHTNLITVEDIHRVHADFKYIFPTAIPIVSERRQTQQVTGKEFHHLDHFF